MTTGDDFDPVAEWSAAQGRVIELMSSATPSQIAVHVPACPDWTTRDLFSHIVGVNADVVAGDEPDDHNEEWTARQVRTRRDRTVDELINEWRSVSHGLQNWIRRNGDRPVNDITIHEQDLRGALGRPGATNTPSARCVRDRFAGRLADAVSELPPLELRGSTWRWVSHPDAAHGDVVVAAPDADLARAVVSRRSATQLRGWTITGDIGPYLGAFASLGDLPDRDLTES